MIVLLLTAALQLSTLGSIQGLSQSPQPISGDNSTGPYNPTQPQDDRALRSKA